jgi:uncharacterized membrane protein YGL010W
MTLFRPASYLMVQYSQYHRSRRNVATHLVGIPLIVLSIGVLLQIPAWQVPGVPMSLPWFFWALTSLWYLSRGNILLGLSTVLVNGGLIGLAHELPVWVSGWGWDGSVGSIGLGLFTFGWFLQFVGHYFEGRKPAFVDDLSGLLVGPMFVVGEVLMSVGLLQRMRMDIERQAGAMR